MFKTIIYRSGIILIITTLPCSILAPDSRVCLGQTNAARHLINWAINVCPDLRGDQSTSSNCAIKLPIVHRSSYPCHPPNRVLVVDISDDIDWLAGRSFHCNSRWRLPIGNVGCCGERMAAAPIHRASNVRTNLQRFRQSFRVQVIRIPFEICKFIHF